MTKLTPEEARALIDNSEAYARTTEYMLRQLPPTPGRDVAEEGAKQLRRGLEQIKKEAEIKE